MACTVPGTRRPRTHSGRRGPGNKPRTASTLVSGISLGQERRAVKPSAQPTLVRTQHLPPPAETARGLGIPGFAGRPGLVPLCVMMCRCAPPHGSGYGHMADGIRPEQAVRQTAGSADFEVWSASVKGSPDPGRSLVVAGLARVWPYRIGGQPQLRSQCPCIAVDPVADLVGRNGGGQEVKKSRYLRSRGRGARVAQGAFLPR